MVNRLIDDCFRPDQQSLAHDAAIALLRARIAPIAAIEKVPLADAAGRVLATPALARSPVPAHTNAAVDGYAFAHATYSAATAPLLPLAAGRSAAGHAYAAHSIRPGPSGSSPVRSCPMAPTRW